MRQVFIADTDEAAESAAIPAHNDWFHSITKLWHEHGDHMPDGRFNWETSTQQETLMHGSPDKVRDQMKHLVQTSGCNYVICSFAWGTFTQEQKLHSLRLFTEEVMPAFV